MSPARANRIHLIRRRVVGGVVALSVAAGGVIGVQLASGNDPAQSSSGSSTTGTTTNSGSTADPQLTTSGQSSHAVSPVTTSQS